jgi:type II secretory pathway pseudopilin PulG
MVKQLTLHRNRAFTVVELLVAMSVLIIVASIAVPSLSEVGAQMRSSDQIRTLASDILYLRGEAIRMRTEVRVTFTTTGYSWDIGDDDSVDGSRTLYENSTWTGGAPDEILINGLGLCRGVSVERTIAVDTLGQTSTLSLNKNGHVTL